MKKSKYLAILLSIGLLTFGGCKPPSSSSSEPVNLSSTSSASSSVGANNKNNYYNESNFIKSQKTVTKTKLVTYDGPSYLHSSSKVDISVNNEDLFVYETRVNHGRKFTWDGLYEYAPVSMFDFEGKVHVEIEVKEGDVTSAQVSPLIYGIQPEINGNVISFDLEYSDNYVIEYNGDPNTSIHLFANPIEDEPITKEMAEKDDSIVYIGPGVYKADAIPVTSNSTIYLAGGAFVYGQIRTEGLENIKICGRGIISGEIYNRRSESEYTIPIEIRRSKNVTLEGITFLDPAGWTIALYHSEDITLDNIKIISARQNSDGISVQSCKDVTVKGGFVRTWDDSLVVKNTDRGNTENILFDGVNVWTDLAQSMEVGYETNGALMNNITFQNITVMHNFHKAAMSIHNCDDADITNVKYKNITIEDAQMLGDVRDDGENDFLIDMTIAYNIDWTQSGGERGTIDGVTIENVKVYEMLDTIVSRFSGEGPTSNIKNVTVKDVEIEGKVMSSNEEMGFLTNQYTSNIKVEKGNQVLGAIKTLPYTLSLNDSDVEKVNHDNITQVGMLVPDFAVAKGDLPFIGAASKIEANVKATHGAGNKTTTPFDDGSGDFSSSATPASFALDGDTSTVWTNKEWMNQDNEFAALTFDFGENLHKIGVVRLIGNPENDFFYTYSFQIWGRRKKSNGEINPNYTRIIGLKDYQMTPGSGNIIDINITTQEYAGIQFRFYRNDELVTAIDNYQIAEVEFYAPSLSFGKAVVESTEEFDVYPVDKMLDGDPTGTSYYESAELPATIVIDLGDVYDVNTFVLCLPPSLLWDARTQKIAIYGSDSTNEYSSNTQFETIVAEQDFLFDPATGNRNIVRLENSVKVRYIKIVITSNDIKGGYNAQLSEFSVYGE
ncbi:MAG: discoidin domain-containing protein [Bacilli bacterium]|nr:discoidin domain-containing protein [Bacilli bacterium]